MSITKIVQNNTETNTSKQESNTINVPEKNNFSFYKEEKLLKKLIKQEKEKLGLKIINLIVQKLEGDKKINYYYSILNRQTQSNEEEICKIPDTIESDIWNIDKETESNMKRIRLLELQLEEIKKIHQIYKIYKRNTYTKNTQFKLNLLFSGIESKIGNVNKEIKRDGEKIRDILKKETRRLTDTLEDDTYRDFIEENISFLNIKRDTFGLETQDTENFLHIFTIKYIDYIEQHSLPKQKPGEIKGLGIDLNELKYILVQVFKEIGVVPKDLRKIKFKIKNNEKVSLDMNSLLKGEQNILSTKEQIKDVQDKLQKLGFYHQIKDGNYESIRKSIIAYQELHDIIPRGGNLGKGDFGLKTKLHLEKEIELYREAKISFTGKISQDLLSKEKKRGFLLGEFIKENGLPEDAKKVFLNCLIKYKIFDKGSVERNKEKLIDRMSILLRFILSMESGGSNIPLGYSEESKKVFLDTLLMHNIYGKDYIKKNKKELIKKMTSLTNLILTGKNKIFGSAGEDGGNIRAKNKRTSAKAALQILNGFIQGVLVQKGSSFITMLTRNKRYFKNNTKWFNIIYENVKENEKLKPGEESPLIISPLDLTSEQTIILWMIDLFERPNTNDHIRKVLQGSQLDMRRVYEDIHHTSNKKITNRKTEDLTTKKMWFFGGELKRTINKNYYKGKK